MSTVLEVDGLQKRYGDHWAVRDASFEVRPGEVFGILGRNGAGKTTTVECLQGLRSPTAGRLRVLGSDPTTDRARLAGRVGSQLQESALPDRLRVHEAVSLFADHHADTDALLERWGLEEHRKQPFAALSGGLRQRLFIVLALLNRPEVVFFDELTQGLDPIARREVWEAILAVRDQGATVVLVTHFMDEAELLCDRLVVFDHGRIIAEGTPSRIVDAHAVSASISFTPVDGVPRLECCPGVRHISTDGSRVSVEGRPEMVAHVCAALVASGPPPADLRIRQPNLEDAVLALEGGPIR